MQAGKMIAVLIDQPLAIAHQIAASLQTLVQVIDVSGIAG
jgi:TusA-related sulfurtransferase